MFTQVTQYLNIAFTMAPINTTFNFVLLVLQSGDIWITPETCEERCGCEGGVVTCQPLGCGENEACVVRNGVRGCYCQDNFILNNDGECVQGTWYRGSVT